MRVLTVGRGFVTRLTFLPNGRQLLLTDYRDFYRPFLMLADVATGKVKYAREFGGGLGSFAGGTQAVRWHGDTISVWDAKTKRQRPVRALPKDTQDTTYTLYGVEPAPDGRTLALTYTASSYSGSGRTRETEHLRAWDRHLRRVLWDVTGVAGLHLAWRPGTDQVAHAGRDGSGALFLGVASPAGPRWRVNLKAEVIGVTVSPDGSAVVIPVGPRTEVYDADTGAKRFVLRGHSKLVRDVAFSPDGRLLATCGEDEKVILWDTQTGRQVHAYHWELDIIGAVAFSPDGLTCAAGGSEGRVIIWDVDD